MYIVNNVTTILSDEEITKINVIDIDEFYNFCIHDFSNFKFYYHSCKEKSVGLGLRLASYFKMSERHV
jgi:hypothetical protein